MVAVQLDARKFIKADDANDGELIEDYGLSCALRSAVGKCGVLLDTYGDEYAWAGKVLAAGDDENGIPLMVIGSFETDAVDVGIWLKENPSLLPFVKDPEPKLILLTHCY